MRYALIFSIIIAIFGIILVSGSLLVIPYTIMEEVRVDKSKTWVDEDFTLQPNRTRTYLLDSILRNGSIFQIALKPSLPMIFRIIDDERSELVFEWLRGGTILWTPPSRSNDWRFISYNPSSTPMNVSVAVTEFYLKATEYKEATYYRSLLDPFYGYNGIVAIIVATGRNVIHLIRGAKSRNQHMHALHIVT